MDESNIDLTIKSGKLVWLVEELRKANAELADVKARLASERANFSAYKAAEAERLANERAHAEKEFEHRVKLLEIEKRRVKAYQEYHNAYGIALNAIKAILCDRITKKDEAKLKPHLDRINAAWMKFDEVLKQCAKGIGVAPWELDICKSKMPPPSCKDAICEDCAAKMGKVPVARPVGHWTGKCDFCGQEKSLSSLSHDYVEKEGAKE